MLLGIDIGGTFTDGVYIDRSGQRIVAKTPSTPQDGFVNGFLSCIESISAQLNKSPRELLQTVERFSHGSTIATNTVIEGTGAKVGMITTKGFPHVLKDMLGTGRVTNVPPEDFYNAILPKPEQVIPQELITEVTERVGRAGEVIVKLNEKEAEKAIRALVDEGIEALAVCFLWSFLNPAHEHRVKQIALKIKPTLFVSCSCDVIPRIGEYQRFVATALNCIVQPRSAAYIDIVSRKLRDEFGFDKPLHIMCCDGGIRSWNEIRDIPIFMIGSGPVGGICAAERISGQIKETHVVAVDMGGTSFDIGLIVGESSLMKDISFVKQWEYTAPMCDIQSIGAGGGSIAWYDENARVIRVGPQSAGATPGPIYYGLGGTAPTVSDADLILGYLNPNIEITGKKLDKAKATVGLANLGKKIGRGAEEMALGIFEIVNETMAGRMRSELISRGLDYREFVLLCYGGAGPVHITEVARVVGIKRCIVPTNAAVFSAEGLSLSDFKVKSMKEVVYTEPWDAGKLNVGLTALEKDAKLKIKATGISDKDIIVKRAFVMLFKGQYYELEVPVPSKELNDNDLAEIRQNFTRIYSDRYGEASLIAGASVNIFRLVVDCIGKTVKLELPVEQKVAQIATGTLQQSRKMYDKKEGGFITTKVYNGDKLAPGNRIEGPALIDFLHTTIRLGQGETCEVDERRNFIIKVGG
jgi:N-methylhydantoinase A